MEQVDMPELVESLGSSDDSIRKRAAFRLQNIVGDPSLADNFQSAGGITKLRTLALNASGNTLAYTLAAFSGLLELEFGWSAVDENLISRVGNTLHMHRMRRLINLGVACPTGRHASPDQHPPRCHVYPCTSCCTSRSKP